jgi:hypothetical protein
MGDRDRNRGAFLFPVAYGIENFFFPGPRNLFERQAGLYGGGYRHVGYGPAMGPAQWAMLGVIVVLAAVILLGARRRHAVRRSRSLADVPVAGPGPATAGGPGRDE